MTEAEIQSFMDDIGSVFPSFRPSGLKFWREILTPVTIQDADLALKRHTFESRLAPAISDIKQKLVGIVGSSQSAVFKCTRRDRVLYELMMQKRGLTHVSRTLPNGHRVLVARKVAECFQEGWHIAGDVKAPRYECMH